jgi:uncharacterized membrane protein YebE (DUF533 family)
MRYLLIAFVAASMLLVATPTQATYTQQFALSQDTTFQGQITVAMLQTSANVMTEAVTVAGHVARASFATAVMQNPTKWQPIMAFLIASQNNNPMTPLTVPSTISDALVQAAMDAQWSNVAGYFKQ